MNSSHVIVVGSGVAGLSAAIRLADAGARVILLERNHYLGGRTRSFKDETTCDIVDNGQHLLMGCYGETLSYLDLISSRHLATLQPSLHIDFADRATGRRSALHATMLPAPLHVFVGLLGLQTISIADRLNLARVGKELLWLSRSMEQKLRGMSVEEWLKSLGQSVEARKHLWDVIAIGSLNDSPATVSALPFVRVLRAAFFGRRTNASMLIPNVGLSELLVDPAVNYIQQRGGQVRLGSAVHSIRIESGRATGVILASGETITAEQVVLAVPHHAVSALLPDSVFGRSTARLSSSPIITVNLWLDRQVVEEEFVALLNGNMQWVFNRSRMLRLSGPGQYLACVISGAGAFVDLDKEALVKMAIDDLTKVFPAVRGASLMHSLVIKEMRATFTPTPEAEVLRTTIASNVQNLHLAGDWTNTGLPSTVEGAIISGRKAAESVLAFQSAPPSY